MEGKFMLGRHVVVKGTEEQGIVEKVYTDGDSVKLKVRFLDSGNYIEASPDYFELEN